MLISLKVTLLYNENNPEQVYLKSHDFFVVKQYSCPVTHYQVLNCLTNCQIMTSNSVRVI